MEGPLHEGRRGDHSVTREDLVRAFARDDKMAAERLLLQWRIEQLEKRHDTEKPAEMLQTYLDTADTLLAVGLVNDARESLEDIVDIAERFHEPEYQEKAQEALSKLPTLH